MGTKNAMENRSWNLPHIYSHISESPHGKWSESAMFGKMAIFLSFRTALLKMGKHAIGILSFGTFDTACYPKTGNTNTTVFPSFRTVLAGVGKNAIRDWSYGTFDGVMGHLMPFLTPKEQEISTISVFLDTVHRLTERSLAHFLDPLHYK